MSELYHYGVKGMKWGIRKRRTNDNPISDARWIARRSVGWNPKNYLFSNAEDNRNLARMNFHRDRAYDLQENRRRFNSKIKLALIPKRTIAVGKHYLLHKLNKAKFSHGTSQVDSKNKAYKQEKKRNR